MKTAFSFLFIGAILLSGCNSAEKQKAAQAEQQRVLDSVAQAAHQQDAAAAQAQQSAAQQKADLTAQVQSLENNLAGIEQRKVRAAAALTTANDELARAKNFHLLRTGGDREAQINAAATKVNELKLAIEKIDEDYAQTTNDLNAAKAKLAGL